MASSLLNRVLGYFRRGSHSVTSGGFTSGGYQPNPSHRPIRPPPPPMPPVTKHRVSEEGLRKENAALNDAWEQYRMLLNIVKGEREIGPPPPPRPPRGRKIPMPSRPPKGR